MKFSPTHAQAGVSIVEVILGVGIITLLVGTVGYTISTYVDARAELLNDTKALYLTEEGLELLRATRDDDWSTLDGLPLNTPRYFDLSGSSIVISTIPEVIDTSFTRSFVVSELHRDSNDDVVDSAAPGATVDDEGRLISMRVAGPTGTTTLEMVLTNLHNES